MPSAPPPPDYEPAKNVDSSNWSSSSMISSTEALHFLREHCKSLFCWGEGPIENMDIVSLEPSTAYKPRYESCFYGIACNTSDL